jgi:homocysteine S-methyltransferase
VFLERPDAIERVHRAYLEAGAEILISASYQMTLAGLTREGLAPAEAKAAMQATVRVARRAAERAGRPAMVAASIGSLGAARADGSEYRGEYGLSLGELVAHHRPSFEILRTAGADLLAIETLPSLDEARAFLALLAPHRHTRAWISFTCRDGRRLADGQPIAEAARWLDAAPQVGAIGVNCCAPEHVRSLIDEIRRGSSKPIVVYPNSGEAWDPVERRWSGQSSSSRFVELARGWASQGVWAIGGCCRIGPRAIRDLTAALSGS